MHEIRDRIIASSKKQRTKCVDFLRQLIAIPSQSQNEEACALRVKQEMINLGYDHVDIDRFGNVIGRIGDGPTKVIFDGHMDTNSVGDRSSWRFDPYRGEVKAGKIYGHGAANNKGGLAALIYAGALIKQLDLAPDCTIYVVATVQAQVCEGLAYRALFDVDKLYPHFVVLSMPTGMRICHGHRGRAEIKVTLRGQPVHAATPEAGFNAIYGLSQIISGAEQLNAALPTDPKFGKATMAVTHIETVYNGSNHLPGSGYLLLDRRLLPGEERKDVLAEVKELCHDTRAKIDIVEFDSPSYKGLRLPMEKFFPSWSLDEDHPLMEAAQNTYRSVYKKPAVLGHWTMSTPGAYTMGVTEIPTIGFGPSEEHFSGPTNDHIRADDLDKCIAFYASLPGFLPITEPVKIPRRRR